MVQRSGYAIAPSDGSPIYYHLSEPDAGAASTVVLCDGIGCDGYVWRYLKPELARHNRVLHWHYRGHGRTPKPRDPRRIAIADLADDLRAVLDDSDTDRAVVTGHSMGVQVALESYRRHPGRVAGLILMCGAPGTPLRTFRGSAALENLLPAIKAAVDRAPGLMSGLTRTILPRRFLYQVAAAFEVNAELLTQKDFMPYLKGLSRVEPQFFLAMLSEAGQHTTIDLLPRIGVPTLVIAGSRDGFTPSNLSEDMAQTIPEAELLVVEDGSHTAPLERPDLVNRAVLDYLRHQNETL